MSIVSYHSISPSISLKTTNSEKTSPYFSSHNHYKSHRYKRNAINNKSKSKVNDTENTEIERDPHRILQRQHQIDLGKATTGYINYTSEVPVSKRDIKQKFSIHPVTPDIHVSCSKRSFDGKIRQWRRILHQWDNMDIFSSSRSLPSTSLGKGIADNFFSKSFYSDNDRMNFDYDENNSDTRERNDFHDESLILKHMLDSDREDQ